jgi:hypothetical protein
MPLEEKLQIGNERRHEIRFSLEGTMRGEIERGLGSASPAKVAMPRGHDKNRFERLPRYGIPKRQIRSTARRGDDPGDEGEREERVAAEISPLTEPGDEPRSRGHQMASETAQQLSKTPS